MGGEGGNGRSGVATRVWCTNGWCKNVGYVTDADEYDDVVNDHGEAICKPCAQGGAVPPHGKVQPFEPVTS